MGSRSEVPGGKDGLLVSDKRVTYFWVSIAARRVRYFVT